MTPFQFAPIVCALLGLALVPTYIHSYAGFTIDDGRTTQSVAGTISGYASTPSTRNATWGKRRFDSDDWIERNYESGLQKVRLTVVRSYDLKALYHHPELAVAYGTPLQREEVIYAAQRPDVPVHVLPSRGERGAMVMYALEYENRFVADPIRFQIRTAAELLFSGRRLMTLFFVTDSTGQFAPETLATSPGGVVLFGAIDSFLQTASHP